MTFDEQLLRSRIELGFSQAEMAKALGISRRTYQYWERQGGKPPHPLMQDGAMERIRECYASDAYEHLFGDKRNTLLTKQADSAGSAPVT